MGPLSFCPGGGGDRLDLERIQRELADREGRDVSIEMIRDVLIKLSRGDLLEYMELGGWFRKVEDPILLEFLRVWGRIEVEGQDRAGVQKELVRHYHTLERRIRDHLGYLAEVYMAQVLWNGQRKTLPCRFFHSEEDVTLPWRFIYRLSHIKFHKARGRRLYCNTPTTDNAVKFNM